jgi:hypothetical protein
MKSYNTLLVIAAICVAALSVPASATLLTLQYNDSSNNVYNCGTWALASGGYGNNVSGAQMYAFNSGGTSYYWDYQQGQSGWTPDVTVSYSPVDAGSGQYMYASGYGGSLPVALLVVDAMASTYTCNASFTFDASAGKQANLYGFSVASIKTLDNVPYEVLDGSNNVLASSTFSVAPGQIIDIGFNPNTVKASHLQLVIETANSPEYLYVGNIEFGEVPEPVTLSLLGLGGMLFVRKNRR